MALEFLTFLSRDFMRLLDQGIDCDVMIEVGNESNKKVFHAHSLILRTRSAHFAAMLSNIEGGIPVFKKPNIAPSVFNILLRYIYGAMIYVNKYDAGEILDLLTAADELHIVDLFEYLQNHLINEKSQWLRENFALAHRIAFQHESFLTLQQYLNMIIDKHPEVIFNTKDFSCLEEDMLVSLLQRDDIAVEEVELWSRIMEWGLAQMPPFTLDINDWRHNEFSALERILRKLIQQIRFFQMSSEDFEARVVPFKPIIPRRLYRDVVSHNLHPNESDNKIKSNIGQPRLGSWNWLVLSMKPSSIDSMLINVKHAALLAIWIDQKDIQSHFVTNPFEFELLLRGSRDGFTTATFHRLCDNKGPTITVIRPKDSDLLIGGYNPYSWDSYSGYERSTDSFIFSMNENDLSVAFCSMCTYPSRAIKCSAKNGPVWGESDLSLVGPNFKELKLSQAKQCDYEQAIRPGSEAFSVDEYEVFQVIRTNGLKKGGC